MKALLDTHALLWFALDDKRLHSRARAVIEERDNDLLVSPASVWEIAIKISLRKYKIDSDFATFFDQQISENDFSILPIATSHAAMVANLPFHHRDPFDRLLAAQAIVEQVPIISIDNVYDLYGVPRIW